MLTDAERSELDMVAFLGLDILRSDDMYARHPYWLCCDEELRKTARARAIAFINEKTIPLTPITEETADEYLRDNMIPLIPAYERWVQLEEVMKQRREEGDPSAFFMNVQGESQCRKND